jgi:hypothetical protein
MQPASQISQTADRGWAFKNTSLASVLFMKSNIPVSLKLDHMNMKFLSTLLWGKERGAQGLAISLNRGSPYRPKLLFIIFLPLLKGSFNQSQDVKFDHDGLFLCRSDDYPALLKLRCFRRSLHDYGFV